MKRSRRKFLKYALVGGGLTAAGGAYWLSTSRTRAARWLRVIAGDTRRRVAGAPVKPNPAAWDDNAITICWIGHATALINFYGVRILTDPSFGSRIGLSLGIATAGPKRYIAPALKLSELPPIDLLLVSHAHMDHLDLPSLNFFAPHVPAVTAHDTRDLLSSAGLKEITELRWNDSTTVRCAQGDVRIEAFAVKHWGRRWPNEPERGYTGYIVRREGKALIFGGDTAETPLFAELRSRGPFEAAIMPIGAYDPWIRNHCTPEQAVDLANMAGARYILPVHHQTFKLSNEPMKEPIERFVGALEQEPERIALRQVGETFICPKT